MWPRLGATVGGTASLKKQPPSIGVLFVKGFDSKVDTKFPLWK